MGLGNIGATELLLILFIILLVFGGSKIPGLAKGLGQGIREFKKALSGSSDEPNESPKEISEKQTEKKK